MVDVPTVWSHRGLPLGYPTEDCETGVKNGQTKHEEWDRKGDDHVELEQPLNGHRGQDKAQKVDPVSPIKILAEFRL